jgi:hypothetical protein
MPDIIWTFISPTSDTTDPFATIHPEVPSKRFAGLVSEIGVLKFQRQDIITKRALDA